MKSVT